MEYAPLIVVVLMFFVQNNVFVKPEALEKKHREILDDVDDKLSKVKESFVEVSAYKEFQNRVLDSIDNVDRNVNELKEFLMKRNNV